MNTIPHRVKFLWANLEGHRFKFRYLIFRIFHGSFKELQYLFNRGTAPKTCTLPSGLCCGYTDINRPRWPITRKQQARIFLSYSSQCETSEMRVSIERPHKKQIIMRIHSIMCIRFPPWTRRLILSGSCP